MQAAVRSALLAALLREHSQHVRSLIGDAIAELASCIIYKGDWIELLPFLCDMARNGTTSEQVVLALTILGKLTEPIDNIQNHIPAIAAVLSSTMTHSSLDVQCACVDTLCKLLSQVEADEQRKGLSKAFPAILALLVRLVESGNEQERAVRVIGSLLELLLKGEGEGELMKGVMDRFAVLMSVTICAGTPILTLLTGSLHSAAVSSMSGFVTALTGSGVQSDDLRHMCMEWMVSFCEDQPRLVRRSKSFIAATLLSAFSLLLSASNTPLQQWAAAVAAEEDDNEDSVGVGLMDIDRLAESVQGAKLGPILLPLYHSMSSPSSSWEYQHAAIQLITQAAEVLPFEDLPIPSILNFLSSSHPRVRYAAVECLGQLALDFKPHLQEQSHEQCFSALLPCLTAGDWPRVQCITAIAYYNLCVDLEESIIDRYAGSLLDVLLSLLTNSVRAVQEQVLQTIGAIATASPNVFASYYQRVMALLKHVILSAKGKELAMLRARAMEAATMIGPSVSREQFRPDAIELTQLFLQLMQQEGEAGEMGLAADDVSEQFLLQAWTRIASVMGEEFSPMLERLLPALFRAAAQHVDGVVRIEGLDESEAVEQEKMIAFEQSLEDKTNALRMLNSFAMDLPSGMFPFVQQCASIVLPLLSYYLSLDIRSYAITLLPLLLKSALAAYKAGLCDVAYVRSLLAAIVSAFLERFKAEESTELKETLVTALRDCVDETRELGIARDTIDAAGLSVVGEALIRMLEVSRLHIESIEHKMEAEEEDEDGMDEESMMAMEASIAKEDSLHYVIADCVGTLIKSHGRLFRPTFQRLRDEILSVLVNAAGEKSKCVSVYLFDDMLEFGELDDKTEVDELLASFMPHVIDFVAPFATRPSAAAVTASASSSLSSSSPRPSSSSSSFSSPSSSTHSSVPSPAPTRQSASLRQACAYGLGACAVYHSASFSPYLDRAVHQLVAAIDSREARLAESDDEERVSVSDIDNCISALGKVAAMDSLATTGQRAPLLRKWLFALPLRDDWEEGEAVYGQLVDLVERHDAQLLGEEAAVLQVLYVLSTAVNSQFVGGEDSELNQRVRSILNEMKRHGYGGTGSGHKSKLHGMSSEQRLKVQQVLEAI